MGLKGSNKRNKFMGSLRNMRASRARTASGSRFYTAADHELQRLLYNPTKPSFSPQDLQEFNPCPNERLEEKWIWFYKPYNYQSNMRRYMNFERSNSEEALTHAQT